MKKTILSFGDALSKDQQKIIKGGVGIGCFHHSDCPRDMGCCDNAPYLGLCMLGIDYRRYCN
ncbi:hypothetical protein [Tenacibaculum halocynthiae]|uniref:hypothetical protein n=1 Tax=Tenacibaculum halocynthiae TaxID=1254437 RepID=UPI0038934170